MRLSSRLATAGAAAFLVVAALPHTAVAQPAACTAPKTTCAGSDGYYASTDDLNRVNAVVDPLLRELRTCFDAAGGKHIIPTIVMRWDSEGKPVGVKVDAPGYETLPCVAKVSGKLSTLQNPHETAIRCEYGCAKPAPPPPVPAPVVVTPPPAATQPAPPPTATKPLPPPPNGSDSQPKAEKTERVWYGWQTLIADAVTIPLFLTGLAVKTPGVTTTGYLSWVFATPVVHIVHGNVGKGFASIAMRLLIPVTAFGIGAVAGIVIADHNRGSGRVADFGDGATPAINGGVIGAAMGVLGCGVLDAMVMAYTNEKVTADKAAAPSAGALEKPKPYTVAPYVDVARGGLGLTGRF